MAGMFYSLQEVAAKLNKTEQEVQEIIKQGRLREFRDGPNLLFKISEVEALMSDTNITASRKASAKAEPATAEEISLAPEAYGRKKSTSFSFLHPVAGKGLTTFPIISPEPVASA